MTVTHHERPPAGGSAWQRLAAVLGLVLPVLRGLLAVAVLLASAVDDLVTAAIGAPPVLPRVARVVRHLAREIGAAFRGGRAGVVDAEVIEESARRWV